MKEAQGTVHPAILLAGPAMALLAPLLPLPTGMSQPALMVAAMVAWMALWWMSEAVPLAVTALLPLALFPLLSISDLEPVAANYANPLIFLFLGGFLMARAMQCSGLSKRLALAILRLSGDRPGGIIAGIMVATAFLSMWVSNTATAMMMVPIGQAIVHGTLPEPREGTRHETAFATVLMLAIAYSATIGGMGTLIGTPPNALFASFLKQQHGIDIGFAGWMLIGMPAVLLLLPLAWLVLTRIAFSLPSHIPGMSGGRLDEALGEESSMTSREKRVAILLAAAALGWIFRPLLNTLFPGIGISDAGIAVTIAILLFVLPDGSVEKHRLLSWREGSSIRWDVLILFGGGLALAEAIAGTGLAAWVGNGASALSALPWPLLLILVMALIVLLGELASNTAIAAVFLPVAGAAAIHLDSSPALLAATVALAASLGFMLPVATPPNAVVYGSGAVSARDMLRAGAILNLVGILGTALVAMTIGPMVFGN